MKAAKNGSTAAANEVLARAAGKFLALLDSVQTIDKSPLTGITLGISLKCMSEALLGDLEQLPRDGEEDSGIHDSLQQAFRFMEAFDAISKAMIADEEVPDDPTAASIALESALLRFGQIVERIGVAHGVNKSMLDVWINDGKVGRVEKGETAAA